jgi:hypothetical protein
MFKPSPQHCTQPNMANFKKRPLAQLITLTLSLSAYGMINNQAHAVASPDLDCTQGSVEISFDAVSNSAPCIITFGVTIKDLGHLSNESTINNQGELFNLNESGYTSTLTNEAGATLTNSGYLENAAIGIDSNSVLINSGILSNTEDGVLLNISADGGVSTLTNSGSLTNNNHLHNDSYGEGSFSNLTNAAGATLTNTGLIANDSHYGGTSNLTNSGTLSNSGTFTYDSVEETSTSGGLYNSSEDEGSTSTFTNAAGAMLTNTGLMVNESYNGGASNLTNSGTLANSGTYTYDSAEKASSYGGLYNNSYDEGSTSTLTNAAGATLTNTGLMVNDSAYYSSSTLNNSGTLTNEGELHNDSYSYSDSKLTNSGSLANNGFLSNFSDYSGTSTLTNKAGAELTNKAYATLDNVSGYNYGGGTSTLSNVGTLTNDGYLTNYSVNGGTSKLDNLGSLTNNGDLTNSISDGGNSTLSNSGILTNNGTIYNYGSIINSGTFDLSSGSYMDNSGSFTQTAGTTIVNGGIYSSGSLDFQGGSLSGSGTIEAESITIGEDATVKPGNSPGTLIMISDLELFGTLQTEIVSSIMGDYDVLKVQGTITLSDDSLFDFFFDDSYVETDGDSFDFLTAFDFVFGSATDFDTWFDRSNFSITGLAAGFGWTVTNQNPNYLSLDIFLDGTVVNPDPNAVSAPGTLGLFGLSLALLGWSSRRRTKLRAHRV